MSVSAKSATGEFSILSKWSFQTFIFSFEDNLLFYSFRRIIIAHACKFLFKVLCLGHIFSRWWSEQIFLVTSAKEIWSPEAGIGRRGAVTLIFSTPSKVWLNYKLMNRRSILRQSLIFLRKQIYICWIFTCNHVGISTIYWRYKSAAWCLVHLAADYRPIDGRCLSYSVHRRSFISNLSKSSLKRSTLGQFSVLNRYLSADL